MAKPNAYLSARIDCVLGDWQSWSSCSATCGGGRWGPRNLGHYHLLVDCITTFLLTGAHVSGLLQCLPLGEDLHAQMSKRRKNRAILNVVFLCVTT